MKRKENTVSIKNDLMKAYQYTVFFEPDEDGGYNVVVPAMPEICTYGDTLEEARVMALDAIRCVVEGNLKRDENIPEDVRIEKQPVKEHLTLQLQPV